MGGSPLSGQPLIRELRSQGMLSLEQAHALVDFAAARDRVELDGYVPTPEDVTAVRTGFRTLDDALNEAAAIEARPMDDAPPVVARASSEAPASSTTIGTAVRSRGPSSALILAVVVLLLVVVPLAGWWYWSTQASPQARIARAAQLYSSGDREGARRAFEEIARDKPNEPLPHVYLGRIARDVGDLMTANRELQTAIRLAPNHPVALREMGSYLLATGNADLARRFYVRAVQENPADSAAMGFLGCALVRLGRADQAQAWFQRAGPGEWSNCMPRVPVGPPPALR